MPREGEDGGQFPPLARAGHPARIRRALRRGSRTSSFRPPRPAGQGGADAPASAALTEWHGMTPGQQVTAWAELRAWVTWLHDRYELSAEDRLPRCWANHPGLIEELWALRAWRLEIYGGGQPQAGQAARYWHAELRQVLHAAATMYAAGCRAGHRGAPALASADSTLQQRWSDASQLAGTPGIDIAAGRARRAGGWASSEDMAAALDAADATPVPGLRDRTYWAGCWWEPAASGWVQVPGPDLPGTAQANGTGPWTGNDTAWEAGSWGH
jgi:hypothetical protein